MGTVDCSEAPAKIQAAEEWRVAGERLHAAAPELFEKVFAMLVISAVGLTEEERPGITESYFLT